MINKIYPTTEKLTTRNKGQRPLARKRILVRMEGKTSEHWARWIPRLKEMAKVPYIEVESD